MDFSLLRAACGKYWLFTVYNVCILCVDCQLPCARHGQEKQARANKNNNDKRRNLGCVGPGAAGLAWGSFGRVPEEACKGSD